MRKFAVKIFGLASLLALIGCPASEPVVVTQDGEKARSVSAPAVPPMKAPDAAMPGGSEDPKLAAIQKEYETAKSAYEKDAKKKDAYVQATVKIGTATMLADSLEARVKYRAALKYYREALALDPKNKEALNNKKMIEDIYTQMGRPIPQ